MLASMQEAAAGAQTEMRGMRDAAQDLPRITKELNKAKRAVVQQLDALLAEIDSTTFTVSNIMEAIEKMISDAAKL
ncbi:hypothetical protein [Delftia sp. RIT313]|uniref:hypothetical protein n=1 Tax=Delftia sp. RIT313 TaxID=1468410 RepID=UPI0012682876|nr:hypothetical protein [Delftia sp. RIT313]